MRNASGMLYHRATVQRPRGDRGPGPSSTAPIPRVLSALPPITHGERRRRLAAATLSPRPRERVAAASLIKSRGRNLVQVGAACAVVISTRHRLESGPAGWAVVIAQLNA